jgi:hypothetical protein
MAGWLAAGRGEMWDRGTGVGPVPAKRDNAIMNLPRAFMHEREFADAVEKVAQKLAGEGVRIRHELDYDWSGDPAVYFRVVMPDASVTEDKLLEATRYVSNMIAEDLQPQEQWGVYPYFRFRSQSEQEKMQEPSWA